MTSTATPAGKAKSHSRMLVVAICFATIVFDGYDLIVYGTVVPTLLSGDEWALTPTEAGRIGSYALIGMLFGAAAVGTVTDLVGRRRIMLGCITWFSLTMGLAALAPTPELFGLARFVAGLGLGGVVPTAIALTIEYAHPRHRSLTNAVMYCGYSVGGILAALIAIPTIPALGWRTMFWIGIAPLFLILPLAYALLPESPSFLLAKGRRAEAEELAARFSLDLDEREVAAKATSDSPQTRQSPIAALFARGYVSGTLLFWLATGIGLLLVYGLNTWLAQIMRQAGYPLGSALAFLLVLNLGAIIGTPVAGIAADRLGSKRVITVMMLTAAACIFLLSLRLPTLALYALVAVAGACSIGTTILVNAYTANYYPARARATGLGWALAVGRLGAIVGPVYGGFVLASNLGLAANFYAFAIPALIGAVTVALIPRSPLDRQESAAESAGEVKFTSAS